MARNILLIDDSVAVRSLLRIYLMNAGCAFAEASDGAQALLLLRTQPVDLVIADIQMPGMDGITFVRSLRTSRSEWSLTPVVLLTANREEELRSRGLAAGASAFVYKPISREELASVIGRLLPA